MMVYPNLYNWQEICSKIYKAYLKDLFIMFNPFNFLRTGEELLTHSFIILAEGCMKVWNFYLRVLLRRFLTRSAAF